MANETQPPAGATAAPAKRAANPPAPPKTRLWPKLGILTHLGAALVLGTIVLFSYVNTLHNSGFALDNKFIILEDPRLRAATKENVKLIFTEDYWWPKAVSGLYRPLTTASYLFNYAVLGSHDKATSYHAINLGLHWIAAVLVYFLVLVLMDRLWPALFAAALFATHPVATESVANMVGRADLFATVAVLGGFLCYAKSTMVRGVRKVPWLAALALITTLGVFCKESAVVVLGVMGLYDLTFRLRQEHPNWFVNLLKNFWRFFREGYVALVLPFAALVYVRGAVFGKLRPPELPFVDNPLIGIGFWEARFTAIKVIGKYFWLLLWPGTLSCDYSYNQIPLVNLHFRTINDWLALVSLAVVVAVVWVAIRNFHRNRPLFFFILFFIGTFLPTSNLFPKMGEPLFKKESWVIGSIMAERFMYLPMIGFVGCLVIAVYAFCRWLIPRLPGDISDFARRTWLQVTARTILITIVVLYGLRTFVRNYDWEDDIVLWTKAVKVCPNSFKTHKSLAYALYEKDPEAKNIDRIIDEGEKAVQITDRTQIVFLHLGAYYRIKGDTLAQRGADGSLQPTAASLPFYKKSVETLMRAVPLDHEFNDDNRRKELARGRRPDQIPDIGNHEIYWNLGLSCMRLGQADAAREAYIYMAHLAPANPDAYMSLATTYIAKNDYTQAAISLLETLLLDNSRGEALRMLMEIYRQLDRDGCAIVAAAGQAQPKLNADCPLVRQHICEAHLRLVQVFVGAKQTALAEQTARSALKSYGCPPDGFQKLLPTLTTSITKGP